MNQWTLISVRPGDWIGGIRVDKKGYFLCKGLKINITTFFPTKKQAIAVRDKLNKEKELLNAMESDQ